MRRLIKQKSLTYGLIFCLIASFAAPSVASAFELDTRVLLCTSQGYQWVTISNDQSSSNSSSSSGESEHCFFCITSDDDQDSLVEYFSSDLGYLSALTTFRYFPSHKKRTLVSNALARAPPIFI